MSKEHQGSDSGQPTNAAREWAKASGSKSRPKAKRGVMRPDVRRYTVTLICLALIALICVIGFTPLSQKITQGLDIKGGVSVIMKASKPDGSAVTDEDMESAVAIVTNRVNSLGASEATVQRQGSDQILVQIPGATDAQQAIDTIGQTGMLEFVELGEIGDQDALMKIQNGASMVSLKPGTYDAFMTGDEIVSVSVGLESQYSAYYAVNLRLNQAGTEKFAEVTKLLAPTNGQIAILLDGVEQSAPAVQSVISSGEVSITGNYTLEQARSFKTVLESGALPVTLEYSESSYVGPTLGQDSLMQGLMAMVIGFAIIFVYLFVFYKGLGMIPAGSLVVFGIVYLGVLAFLSAQGAFALSLPGMAGIVLTIGMAADSSILVLERFREELRAGRGIRAASVSGSKHGIGTALDAGAVSLISAFGLFFLTTGSAKGFGLTLALGVICSFFTLLMFTTPLLRLLGRRTIAANPGFWGVKDDIEEGLHVAAKQGFTVDGKVINASDVSAVKGGGQDA